MMSNSAGDQGKSMNNYELAIALLNEEWNDFLEEQTETARQMNALKEEISELKVQLASKNSIINTLQEKVEKLVADKMVQFLEIKCFCNKNTNTKR